MMIRTTRLRKPASRSGFTLAEAVIVSMFTAFLATLISATWSAFVRPTADIAERCRVAQEASLALAALSRDFAGSYSDDPTGDEQKLKLVGRTQPDNSQLRLCFDGGTTPNGIADWAAPDLIVTYYVDSNRLVRWDEDSGTTFIVARDLDSFEATDLGGGQVQLDLTFQFRNINQTYHLIASDP
jgi:type II secretory pathway component PulJ